jgi:hypothetical protein
MIRSKITSPPGKRGACRRYRGAIGEIGETDENIYMTVER